MERSIHVARNRLFHLEDALTMYGTYDAQSIERIIKTINKLYNDSTGYKKIQN